MNDDKDEKLDRLFTAARGFRPETSHLQEHFETRLMASIQEKRSSLSTWFVWEWRLVPAFAVLAIILVIVTLITDFYRSQDILASIVSSQENQIIARYLTGG